MSALYYSSVLVNTPDVLILRAKYAKKALVCSNLLVNVKEFIFHSYFLVR